MNLVPQTVRTTERGSACATLLQMELLKAGGRRLQRVLPDTTLSGRLLSIDARHISKHVAAMMNIFRYAPGLAASRSSCLAVALAFAVCSIQVKLKRVGCSFGLI